MPQPRRVSPEGHVYSSSPSSFNVDNTGELEDMEIQSPTSQRQGRMNNDIQQNSSVKQCITNSTTWMILFAIIATALLVSTIILAIKLHSADSKTNSFTPMANSNGERNALTQLSYELNSAIDPRRDPCNNFYAYACGNWLKSTKLPGDETRWARAFSGIEERNRESMKLILEQKWPLLASFYDSCLDTSTRNRLGAEPIREILDMFDDRLFSKTNHPEELFFHLLGRLQRKINLGSLFSVQVGVNDRAPQTQWLSIGQGGLSLPSVQHYLTMPDMLVKYSNHIAKMLHLTGVSEEIANTTASEIVLFERAIAEFTKPPVDLRDPDSLYNPFSINSISAANPSLPWGAYFEALDIPFADKSRIIGTVTVPNFFANLSSLLVATPIQKLLQHTRWRILNKFASDLSEPFALENFDFFNKQVHGQKTRASRTKNCISRTTDYMGDLTGRYFMERSFGENSVKIATDMIKHIKVAFRNSLPDYAWMDNTTRQAALTKLHAVEDLIGGQQNYSLLVDYTEVTLDSKEYLRNLMSLTELANNVTFARLSEPTNKHIWQMTASMVNAYYEPTLNTINFPAGILQPPFFDAEYPETINLAGIGMVMGHELTHGFDDQGRQYDGSGTLRQWWTNNSVVEFKQHAKCFEEQYSNYTYTNGSFTGKVNGQLTLGENVADNGGIHLSYEVHRRAVARGTQILPPTEPKTTPDQLFFLRYAQNWCQLATDEYVRTQLLTDPHSPAFARVNGPLSNFAPFANAYQCPVGSYMNPSKKCSLY